MPCLAFWGLVRLSSQSGYVLLYSHSDMYCGSSVSASSLTPATVCHFHVAGLQAWSVNCDFWFAFLLMLMRQGMHSSACWSFSFLLRRNICSDFFLFRFGWLVFLNTELQEVFLHSGCLSLSRHKICQCRPPLSSCQFMFLKASSAEKCHCCTCIYSFCV